MKGIYDKIEIADIKKLSTRHKIEDVIKAVSGYYGINKDELLKRKIAIYLSKTLSGEKNIDIGKLFNITPEAVTNALRDINKMKEDDKKLNKEIALIEKEIGR